MMAARFNYIGVGEMDTKASCTDEISGYLARIADLEEKLDASLNASKFCANVADDLRAELAAIMGQEPVAWEVYYSDDDSFNTITRDKAIIEYYSKMAYTIKPLYAATAPSAVVMPAVPNIQVMARFLSDKSADVLGHSRESTWVGHGDHFIEIVTEMMAASQAAKGAKL